MREAPESRGETVYIVPSRIVRGTKDEMLAELDEAIQGLLALRALVATPPPPDRGPTAPTVKRSSRPSSSRPPSRSP